MDTGAVYTIREDGKEFYFYTKYAGGFSYPFEAAGYLSGLKRALRKPRVGKQDVCVAPLLAQMKGTYFFPDELEDQLLFQETTKEIAEGMKKDVPFHITVDVNQYTVGFHFNDQFEELADLEDITIPCYEPTSKCSGGYFINESLARQKGESDVSFHETNEMIFRELIEQAVMEQGQTPDQTQDQQMAWGYYG